MTRRKRHPGQRTRSAPQGRNVDASLPNPAGPADTDFTVVVAAPLSEAAIFDYLAVFEGGTLRAAASMREES